MASSPCLAAGAIGSRRALFIDAPSVSTSGASPCPGACCTLGPSTLTTVPTVTREVAEHSASGELLFEDEDYRIIDPEGRIRWVRDLTAIIRDGAGEISRYIGYIFECTARHEAVEALGRATRSAEAATRAKTAFFGNVSDEFRTHLTLMLGPLEDLLGGIRGELSGPVADDLRMVQRNALRLSKLVDALLDFARIEAGRAEAAFEPVDLAALTTDLASTFRSAV